MILDDASASLSLSLSLTAKTGVRVPLGSANQINGLYRISQLLLFPSPIFLQINSGTRGTGLLRVLVPPICYEEYPKAEVVSSNLAGRANIFNALCRLAYMPPGC